MEKQQLLYLSREDVASTGLTMDAIIDALEDAFRDKGEGKVDMPPKPAIHPGAELAKIRYLHLPPDIESKVLGGNIARLAGLS